MQTYRISGTINIPKDKAATFNYELFETDDKKEFINYIQTHATVPVILEDGHRAKKNIKEILPIFRIDCDDVGADKIVEKKLKKAGIEYFKKPSTSYHPKKAPHKMHFIIVAKNVSQDYDTYKEQYRHFIADLEISPNLIDMSLASPVQNMNRSPNKYKDVIVHHKGKPAKAAKVKAPKKPKVKHKKLKGKEAKALAKRLKKELNTLDPDMPYPHWFEVGLALHTEFGDAGYELFKKWSKKGEKFDEKYFDEKWLNITKTNEGVITSATIFNMKPNGKQRQEPVDPLTLFKKEEGSFRVAPKPKKSKDGLLHAPDKVSLEDLKKMITGDSYLYEGLMMKGMVSVLYGAAGTNKTTVAANAVITVLKAHPDYVAHYYGFDPDPSHLYSMVDYAKEEGVDDRFDMSLTNKETFFDYYTDLLKKARKKKKRILENVVIVVDTLKFIVDNINDKASNHKVLALMKALGRECGATILLLAHSNKDGEKNSGTAEIEQDTDMLLRIDRSVNSDAKEALITVTPLRVRGMQIKLVFKNIYIKTQDNVKYHLSVLRSMHRVEDEDEMKQIEVEVEAKKKEEEILSKDEKFREKHEVEFDLLKKHLANLLSSQNKLDLTMQSRLVSDLSSGDLKIGSVKLITDMLHKFVGHGLSELRHINNRGQVERFYYVADDKKQLKSLKKRMARAKKKIQEL